MPFAIRLAVAVKVKVWTGKPFRIDKRDLDFLDVARQIGKVCRRRAVSKLRLGLIRQVLDVSRIGTRATPAERGLDAGDEDHHRHERDGYSRATRSPFWMRNCL